ncbi:MAG: hypothetical protein WBY93_06060 [Candidatus Binatus sp.]
MRKTTFRFARVTVTAAALSVMMLAMPAEYAAAQSSPAVGPSAPGTQIPQPQDNNVNWPGAGYGVGALLCNVLYIPAKLTYAVVGGVVGGGTYLVTAGNQTAANTVWRSSLGGDYVVTPQMLAGQQPINFSGPTNTPPNVPAAANSPQVGTVPTSTASSGGVAPITPLPPSGSASSASASSAGGQPLDHGSGPAASSSNIE